jgi:hypothetical protein
MGIFVNIFEGIVGFKRLHPRGSMSIEAGGACSEKDRAEFYPDSSQSISSQNDVLHLI